MDVFYDHSNDDRSHILFNRNLNIHIVEILVTIIELCDRYNYSIIIPFPSRLEKTVAEDSG